jgi:hypothetical protein
MKLLLKLTVLILKLSTIYSTTIKIYKTLLMVYIYIKYIISVKQKKANIV